MPALRVVADCNVFISLLIGGSMGSLARYLFSEDVELILSESLLAEIDDVGRRGHLRKYFDHTKLDAFLALLREYGEVVPDADDAPRRSRDPDDDYLLGVCENGRADVLITGDKDLLVLKEHEATTIVTVAAFRRRYMK
jgi:putative PIN family toxin of toxin-antitoxin system